jgi:hypothetical protein
MLAAFSALALVAFASAHVALLAGLARQGWKRCVVALVLPPLAGYWGWTLGMRRRAAIWLCAMAVYAIGVAVGAL